MKCLFCDFTGTRDELIAHSAQCEAHPLWKGATRYRYVRDVAFQYANVSLTGNDDDGTAFVIFEPKIYLPDLPGDIRYEEEDWDSSKIDAAIDAALSGEGGQG